MSVETSLITKTNKTPEKLDKNSEYRKELLTILQSIVQEINGELGDKLLSADGAVSRKGYNFSEKDLADQKQYISKKEDHWIRQKYEIKANDPVTEEIKLKWEKEQQKRLSELMEMAVMVILHKVLKEDYVVCRANKYDDYHGVDNIIVNKHTGTVLCAFDDVKDKSGGYYEWQKEEYATKYGSSNIAYGFTFEAGELVRKEIAEVPKFYLRFDKKQLENMLKAIDYKNINPANNEELLVYNFIIESLASQIDDLKKQGANNQLVTDKLDNFKALLPNLRDRGKIK